MHAVIVSNTNFDRFFRGFFLYIWSLRIEEFCDEVILADDVTSDDNEDQYDDDDDSNGELHLSFLKRCPSCFYI